MAVDFFLKIDGIKGESQDDKHKDEIDVFSWSWGLSNSGTTQLGGGGGSGKVNCQDFSFSMPNSKASPELMKHCNSGKHIKQALFTCRKAGGKQMEYLKIKMEDLLITSFQAGGSPGEDHAIDSLSINFAKVEYTYAPQKADGTLGGDIIAKYDYKANKE